MASNKELISKDPAVITIVSTALVTYLAIFLQIHFFAVSSEKRIDDLASNYHGLIEGAKFSVFDTAMDALVHFAKHVEEMDKIRNTSVCAKDEIGRVKAEYMDNKWYGKYIMAVLKPLKDKNLTYFDILTPGILEIKEHRYFRLMEHDLGEKYSPKILDSDIKFTEFTIIEYKGSKKKEVMFGWDHAITTGKSRVFLTNQPELVAYFENMFAYLWGKSDEIPKDHATA